ncbi:LIPA.2 family protein [Megaselia abdita]
MELKLKSAILIFIVLPFISASLIPESSVTTEKLVKKHGYSIEEHQVQTADGYILTMHRIPYSPKLNNSLVEDKPIVFLQHGLLCSSSDWVLLGPESALAYLLSDQGYDVWMGNARGNRYSRKHAKYSPTLLKFWNFDWNEIAIHDLPAMIDYILFTQNQTQVTYAGHSQGTTTYLVMSSMIPNFASKIRSAHLLSPVAFMGNMESTLVYLLAPVLGHPNGLVEVLGSAEFLPNTQVMEILGQKACSDEAKYQELCANVLFLIAGYDDENLNRTMIPEILAVTPAGASVHQITHYLQEFRSGYFRQFDHFYYRNKKRYGSYSPPNYDLKQLTAPVHFYYGTNDKLASVTDVMKLAGSVPKSALKGNYKVPHEKFNHLDFIWAIHVKELLYDKVIKDINSYF